VDDANWFRGFDLAGFDPDRQQEEQRQGRHDVTSKPPGTIVG
jgi:hypothetical protein